MCCARFDRKNKVMKLKFAFSCIGNNGKGKRCGVKTSFARGRYQLC